MATLLLSAEAFMFFFWSVFKEMLLSPENAHRARLRKASDMTGKKICDFFCGNLVTVLVLETFLPVPTYKKMHQRKHVQMTLRFFLLFATKKFN